MAAMPDFEADIKREWAQARDTMRDLMHPRHHDAPERAPDVPQPAEQSQPSQPQENMMQLLDDFDALAGHVKEAAATLEGIDRDALAKASVIKATPAGAEAYDLLHTVAAMTGAEPLLAIVTATLKGVAALAPQQPAA
jgi:hypothetical protein